MKRRMLSSELLLQMEKLAVRLEAMRISDYLEFLQNPKKLIWSNFVGGIARGLGFALGTTLVFAVVIEVLRRIILIHIPVISDYLFDIIKLMDMKR